MLDVDGVKTDDGGIEADVGFCNVAAEIVWRRVLRQVSFCSVEGIEEGLDGFFIGFLRSILLR